MHRIWDQEMLRDPDNFLEKSNLRAWLFKFEKYLKLRVIRTDYHRNLRDDDILNISRAEF